MTAAGVSDPRLASKKTDAKMGYRAVKGGEVLFGGIRSRKKECLLRQDSNLQATRKARPMLVIRLHGRYSVAGSGPPNRAPSSFEPIFDAIGS
jgi:hypothetical protein